MQANVVIVGGGHAGGMTAIFLRQINYSGSIIVIGEEEFLPYQRPSLSKGFLSAEIEEKRLYLKSDNFYKKNNISMICNTHVKDILKDQKKIILDDGKVINFDNLVLCTGSIVKKIDYPELESNILYLRDIKDSLKIRDIIKNNKKIAIIGAGYIGLEIASIIRKNKINTTIIELENRLMKRVASKELASYFEARHRDEGVQFKLQTSIGSMYKKGQKINIECSDNSIISSDIVIAGIGVLPNVTLAVNMGLKCNNGIVVDEFCQTSHKNIFAAGDCTNHHNHIFKKNAPAAPKFSENHYNISL